MPFGIWRIDWYFIRAYLKAFLIILAGLAALVAIGDMFQRFDDFIMMSRREELDFSTTAWLFLRYYSTYVPQLIFQYMLPVVMLLAASITATSSYSGPRGNNEYTVIRSAGIPVLRSFFPLLLSALLIGAAFQGTRDMFLPGMVRESIAILNRLRQRVSMPTSVTVIGRGGLQTVAVGSFSPNRTAHNIVLEARSPEAFQRGDSASGDNDFIAYRAAAARLEQNGIGEWQWVPVDNARKQTFTRYSRREVPWTEPVPTSLTPAMIERQTLGEAVSSWRDLIFMGDDHASAKFELHWRLADPVACCLLVLLGAGLCMGRMLRGSNATYVHAVTLSMLMAALFYIFRLAGRSLWEAGLLGPQLGVWLPMAAATVLAIPLAWWMEP
jgi:lipopolysaccharide export LptBFGC system permease protein LptF